MPARDLMVYVSCAETREVFRFSMDRQTGALAHLDVTPVPGTTAPSPYSAPLALSPDRRFLYAVLRTAPFPVVSFAIDPATGALAQIGSTNVPATTPYLSMDRTGRFLLGASYQGFLLWVGAIDPQGRMKGPVQVVDGIQKPHCVLVHPNNRFAYVAATGEDQIRQFLFDAATGRLSPNTPMGVKTKPGAGPRHMAFHPTADFFYCLNETVATIDAYALNRENGTLTPFQNISTVPPGRVFTGHEMAADLHIGPDGRFLYASERAHSTISVYAVATPSGVLSHVQTIDVARVPRGFRIDPTGRFLVAGGQDSGCVTTYAIDQGNGKLERLASYRTNGFPTWIEFVDLEALNRSRAGYENA
jgi:6-phosphogluconolactonase